MFAAVSIFAALSITTGGALARAIVGGNERK